MTRSGYFGSIVGGPTSPVLKRGEGNLAISFADFLDMAPDIPIAGPTIRLAGSPDQTSAYITVATPERFDTGSIRWILGDTQITGNMISGSHGETLTLGPRIDNRVLYVGTHFLTVEVSVNGVPYSRRISFTVMR